MQNELRVAANKYLRDQQLLPNPSLKFCVRRNLKKNFIALSKVNTYCLVTGRVRYTIKHAQVSRHIFFELTREGLIPGFFFGS